MIDPCDHTAIDERPFGATRSRYMSRRPTSEVEVISGCFATHRLTSAAVGTR